MPLDLSTIQSLLGVTGQVVWLLGLPIGIYLFLNKDKTKDGDRINDLKGGEQGLSSKIELLKTELTGEIKNLATQLGGEMKLLTQEFNTIKLNHLHTIEEKQKDQDAQIGKLTIATEKLTTIIDERVPRKTVDEVK